MSNILQMNTSFYCQHIFHSRLPCSRYPKQPRLSDVTAYFSPCRCSISASLAFLVCIEYVKPISKSGLLHWTFPFVWKLLPSLTPGVSIIHSLTSFRFLLRCYFSREVSGTLYNIVTCALPYPHHPPGYYLLPCFIFTIWHNICYSLTL